MNVDSIFISSGVHRNEFKNENELKDLMNKYEVNSKYFQKYFPGNMKIYNNLNNKNKTSRLCNCNWKF